MSAHRWIALALPAALSLPGWGQRMALPPGRPGGDRPAGESIAALQTDLPTDIGSTNAPLLFGLGLHIEPFGAEVSRLVPGRPDRPPRPAGPPAAGLPVRPTYLNAMTEGLLLSLRAVRPDRVNVFHVTVHPQELPDELLGAWLEKVVDPLARSGRVRWATFSQMADAWRAWEKANPGVDPRAAAAPAAPSVSTHSPRGYMTFAVNVHDFTRLDDSAGTLLKLVDIFRRHGVKADFYFTGPYVQTCAEKRPDVLRVIREAGMGVGYHTRPPHPAHAGYGVPLAGLGPEERLARLRAWETTAVNLATAELIPGRPGGYALVKQALGSAPVCVSPLAGEPGLRRMMLGILRDLGARMVVQYHESGADPDRPFEQIEGLWMRPSDFSITRWPGRGEGEASFWWNRLGGDGADPAAFDPVARLKTELAAWTNARPPFVTALIHENDFTYEGGPGWQSVFTGPGRRPKPPPYDLAAADAGRPRTPAEREAILKAYDALVACAAANLRVVTAADLVALAEASRGRAQPD